MLNFERGLDGKIPKAANAVAAELHSIPIAREADGSVTPYLSNAQLYAIMEDVTQYHSTCKARLIHNSWKPSWPPTAR